MGDAMAENASGTDELDIIVKTVQNEVYTLGNVSSTTLVSDLKRKISDLSSVAAERQRLIYRGNGAEITLRTTLTSVFYVSYRARS